MCSRDFGVTFAKVCVPIVTVELVALEPILPHQVLRLNYAGVEMSPKISFLAKQCPNDTTKN